MMTKLLCLIRKFFCGFCPKEEEPEPIEELEPVKDSETITRAEYLSEMAKVGINPISLATPLDATLALASKEELDRIAPHLVYPADDYIAQVCDCEDYGLRGQCDAAFIFHASGVRLGLGHIPQGYHGFLVTMDIGKNIWWMEPNAGFPWAGVWHRIGERDYQPDKILV